MNSLRKHSLAAGIFYLLTFVSIPAPFIFYAAVRAPNFIVGSGPDGPVFLGAFLEVVVALAGIGTAIALYPVVKRQGESRALGLVASRTLEAATIYAGIVSLMTLMTLRQASPGAGGLLIGSALSTQYTVNFFFGQSFFAAINGVLLGSLLYQSRLVPRWLPILGFVGATLLMVSWGATMFGFMPPGAVNAAAGLLALPVAAWEFSLGIYLTFWGFKPSPITADSEALPARLAP